MPASSTVTNWVNSLFTQTLFTLDPLISKVCKSSFCEQEPVLVIFRFPTGEVGKLELSWNLRYPETVRRNTLSLSKFLVGGLPMGLTHPELISALRRSESSWPESLFDLKGRQENVCSDI